MPKNAKGQPCGYGGKKDKLVSGSVFDSGAWMLYVDDPNGHLATRAGGKGLAPYQCLIELCDAVYEDEPWFESVLAYCYPERTPAPEAVVVPIRPELVLIEGDDESVKVAISIEVEAEDLAA